MPEHGISDRSKAASVHESNNFVDMLADEYAQEFAAKEAAIDTAEMLQRLNDRIEAEIHSRERADKKAIRREYVSITIGLLTLAATVLFGILALRS